MTTTKPTPMTGMRAAKPAEYEKAARLIYSDKPEQQAMLALNLKMLTRVQYDSFFVALTMHELKGAYTPMIPDSAFVSAETREHAMSAIKFLSSIPVEEWVAHSLALARLKSAPDTHGLGFGERVRYAEALAGGTIYALDGSVGVIAEATPKVTETPKEQFARLKRFHRYTLPAYLEAKYQALRKALK